MIVADTSVWIDYVRGVVSRQTDLLDEALLENRVVTGDLIIAEFLQGFREGSDLKKAKEIMDSLEYFDLLGRKNAYRVAENYRNLRKQGVTHRKMADLIIATFCIEQDFELIHNDRDFDPLEGLLGLRVRR